MSPTWAGEEWVGGTSIEGWFGQEEKRKTVSSAVYTVQMKRKEEYGAVAYLVCWWWAGMDWEGIG